MPAGIIGNRVVDASGRPLNSKITRFEIVEVEDGRVLIEIEDPKGIEVGVDSETGLPLIRAEKVVVLGLEGAVGSKRGKER